MALLSERGELADTYVDVQADEAVPLQGDAVLPLGRFLAGERAAGHTGVRIATPEDLDALVAAGLDGLALICVHFHVSKDGRGYSLARLLRDRHGWQGELRATGDVKRDQLFYMRRVGFDTFRLKPGQDPVGALKAFSTFSTVYQAAADGRPPVYLRETV